MAVVGPSCSDRTRLMRCVGATVSSEGLFSAASAVLNDCRLRIYSIASDSVSTDSLLQKITGSVAAVLAVIDGSHLNGLDSLLNKLVKLKFVKVLVLTNACSIKHSVLVQIEASLKKFNFSGLFLINDDRECLDVWRSVLSAIETE